MTPLTAQAEEERGFAEEWTGAFVGVGLFGGVLWPGAAQASAGGSGGATLRVSQVMSLVEAQLDYRFALHDESGTRQVHAAALSVGLHPLFLLNLGADELWYALASTYLQLGLSYSGGTARHADADWESGFGMVLSAGFDYPLSDPDEGSAAWLGVFYRFALSGWDRELLRGGDLVEHVLALQLGWRINGLW